MFRGFPNKEYGVIIRPDSEFNVQAELYIKLKEKLEPLGFSVFGVVRLLGETKFGGARRQKGRLDIGIIKKNKILCAVEVKGRKLKGWERQRKKYLALGVPNVLLCFGKNQIAQTIKLCEDYLIKPARLPDGWILSEAKH